jgi:hypothetical protein
VKFLRRYSPIEIAIVLAIAGILIAIIVPAACAPRVTQSAEQWTGTVEDIAHFGMRIDHVYRVTDEERGVLCYIARGFEGISISCVREVER